jgi:hypothetical protein
MTLDIPTVCGLLGATVFVIAYFANLQGWLRSSDWRYPAANMVGALMILISLMWDWNLPSVMIESFWAAISLYGIIRSRWQAAATSHH